MNDSADQGGGTPAAPAQTPPPAHSGSARAAWLAVAIVAGVAGWQWYELRSGLVATQEQLARRLAESDTAAKEARALARQAQEDLAAAQGKIGALESRLGEAQSQQAALEGLYQELSRNRDEWMLAEVEQILSVATQQLQLAANVQAAIAALQTAEARLARGDRPQFMALRKAIGRDLERLKRLPYVDQAGISMRLESVISAVDALPFGFEHRPVGDAARKDEAPRDNLILHLGRDLWAEIRQLVRVERLDRPDPGLLAPRQIFFLRENLKLRLLNARLAMFTRDSATFRSELARAQQWLAQYFDPQDRGVQSAQQTLKQLAAVDVGGTLPNLEESLSALRSFKIGRGGAEGK